VAIFKNNLDISNAPADPQQKSSLFKKLIKFLVILAAIGFLGLASLFLTGKASLNSSGDQNVVSANSDKQQTNNRQGNQRGQNNWEDFQQKEIKIPVETSNTKRNTLYAFYTGTASLYAENKTEVAAKTGGQVIRLNVEEGDQVRSGQVLLQIESERLQLEVKRAQANFDKITQDINRKQDLYEQKLIPRDSFESLRYDMQSAEAALALAKLDLSHTRVKSPISGVISARTVQRGNIVGGNQVVFEVTSLSTLQADLYVPERELASIQLGQKAQVNFDALPGSQHLEAKIKRISPVIDAKTGTFKTTLEINNKEGFLKPGMFGRFRVVFDERADVMTLPRTAIIEIDSERSIFHVVNDQAKKIVITTGFENDGIVEVLSGLDGTEAIVTLGQAGLRANTKVNVVTGPNPRTPEYQAELDKQEAEEAKQKARLNMRILKFITSRPIAISMLMVVIVLFGAIALTRLKVTLLPDLSYPTLTIRTQLSGAAPSEIETLISKPIEETASIIKNLKLVRSVSKAGQSDVTLEFNWGTNMDLASVDVREKIDLLNLPDEADKPILLRFDPSSEPIMRYALIAKDEAVKQSGTSVENKISKNKLQTLKRLRRYADERLKTDLEGIEGTASVKISGGFEDEIQITVDQNKLAQKGLTIQSIANRLQQENINMSGGQIEQDSRRFQVRTVNQFSSIDDIKNTIVSLNETQPTYLYEIADVKMLYKQRKAIIRVDGKEAIELAIYKEGDANTVKVAEKLRKKLDSYVPQKEIEIKDKDSQDTDTPKAQSQNRNNNLPSFLQKKKEYLPAGTNLKQIQDQSVFIDQAISQVKSSAFLGGLLAIFVLYGFLRDARSTWIIALTIPVSVIGTFFLMNLMDLSLNIMSLGGIALAIGLLVDNSIVVLENIAQKRDQGEDRVDASINGTSQVAIRL